MSESAPFVFVVGCPRSGTSPFASWLASRGLATASDDRRDSGYPVGYYEHLPILMFHKAMERRPRRADHRITLEAFLGSDILGHAFSARMFELAFAPILNREFEFLKFPQLALSIEFLFERFPHSHVIALWRDPATTFRSLVVRELPNEMIPSSGLKSVLLWNLYAYHLVRAKRARPEQVTVVNIDHFLSDADAPRRVLERIGRPQDDAAPASDAIDRSRWRTRVSLPWRIYHRSMVMLARCLRSRLGPERACLADQRDWERELLAISDLRGPVGTDR